MKILDSQVYSHVEVMILSISHKVVKHLRHIWWHTLIRALSNHTLIHLPQKNENSIRYNPEIFFPTYTLHSSPIERQFKILRSPHPSSSLHLIIHQDIHPSAHPFSTTPTPRVYKNRVRADVRRRFLESRARDVLDSIAAEENKAAVYIIYARARNWVNSIKSREVALFASGKDKMWAMR